MDFTTWRVDFLLRVGEYRRGELSEDELRRHLMRLGYCEREIVAEVEHQRAEVVAC